MVSKIGENDFDDSDNHALFGGTTPKSGVARELIRKSLNSNYYNFHRKLCTINPLKEKNFGFLCL